MVGLISIIIYMLCAYLCLKGVEIFQIALMSPLEKKKWGIAIGIISIALGIVVSIVALLDTMNVLERILDTKFNLLD